MKTLLCVGDSHSRLIGTKPTGSRFRYGRVSAIEVSGFDTANVVSIKGATAAGFYPKKDRQSSFSRVARAIRRLDPDVICFGFGQVDAELSCYFVALRDNIPLEDAIKSRLNSFPRYMESCGKAAGHRQIVVKGLNTATLQDSKAMRKMLHRRIRAPLELPRGQFSQKIENLGITLERHWKINADISAGLRQAAEAQGFPYFDLRKVTSLEGKPGLSKPEYCLGGGDVHLRQSAGIEHQLSQGLARAATNSVTCTAT
ncbi:hypothetical protein [Ruegeria lacuscaerulensis]|uniref:hypothetical protein n=1 Tax=Ruegeria lacuscaerulensis TaxID=55218 RepID=UPI001480073C|nr:hypothetical protein [Ruegeria lacuscaerulensis]